MSENRLNLSVYIDVQWVDFLSLINLSVKGCL